MAGRRQGGWYVREESIEEADARFEAWEQGLVEWARVLGMVQYVVERDGYSWGTRLIVKFDDAALLKMANLSEAFEHASWEWVE